MFTTPATTRTARLVLTAAALVAGTRAVQAQDTADRSSRLEILVPSGTLLPTGAQHDAIKRGNLTALQVFYLVRPNVAITSTVGWARSRDIATVGSPKLDVFTYDVGAELRGNAVGTAVTFKPFLGAGAGARSYNYRSLDVDATHNLASYASLGGEIGYRRVALRLEGRDYVTGFKPLAVAGTSDRRNDVAIMAGIRITR